QLRPIIVESPVPDAMVQFEERLEPLVKRFDRFLAPCIDAPPRRRLQVGTTLATQLTTVRSCGIRGTGFRLDALVVSGILRAQKAAAGALAVLVDLHRSPHVIGVIAAIRRYAARTGRQLGNLLAKTAGLAGAGHSRRCQQRKNGGLGRRTYHDFEA